MISAEERVNHMIATLKGKGHRLTSQRLAILRVLAGSEGHPSVEQIYERIKRDFPLTSLATVYKTVAVLREAGEVLELAFSDGGARYDGKKPYPHPHLVCVRCKNITDPQPANLTELLHELARDTGYQVVAHRLDIYGVCPKCQDQALSRDV